MISFDPKLLFAIGGVVFGLIGFVPYFRDMFSRKTQPHLYTWLIWCLTQGTATVGVWYGGGGFGAAALSAGTLMVFVVFLFSFKYGTKNITRSDTLILIAAIAMVLVWWQLHNPLLAVLMAIAIDLFGYIPTWRKSVAEPWSETVRTWAIFVIASLCTILALQEYNFFTAAYLVAITVANAITAGVCLWFRRKVARPGI